MNLLENSPQETIKTIESKYDLQSITCHDTHVWDFLRYNLFFELEKQYYKLEDSYQLKKYWNIPYNKMWKNGNVNNNSIMFFTDIHEQRKLNKHMIDKLGHNIINTFFTDTLTVIHPLNNRIKGDYLYNAISSNQFYPFFNRSNEINNISILNELQKNVLDLPFESWINKFFSIFKNANKFFKNNSVKTIFVNCYYHLFHQAIIYAAKLNNIKVLEIQHGIIHSNQYYYNPSYRGNKMFLPDYLLAHNQYVQNHINKNYLSSSQIIPFGNYYLEYKINTIPRAVKLKGMKRFKKKILISHQSSVEKSLLNTIDKLGLKNPQQCFLILMRNEKKSTYQFHAKNVFIINEVDIYDLMQSCDLHISIYSTMILETLYAGIPNILINKEYISEHYFAQIIKPSNNVWYVNDVEKICDLIKQWPFDAKDIIKKKYNYLFYKNQQEQMHIIQDIMK